MSDPSPTPEPPLAPPGPDPVPQQLATPLARYSDPSLPRPSAERTAPHRGSVEWVRPAEIHRRTSIRIASATLDAARRVVEMRHRLVRTAADRARDALASRATRLTGQSATPPPRPGPDSPSREGPGL
jgi:hypothetical protein